MLEYNIVVKVLNHSRMLWEDWHSDRLVKYGLIRKPKTA